MDFGFMRLQVSEVGKLGLLFVLAHYLTRYRRRLDSFVFGYLIPCAFVAVFCGLIMLEPDFGTAFCAAWSEAVNVFGECTLEISDSNSLIWRRTVFIGRLFRPRSTPACDLILDVEGNQAMAYQLWQGILAGSGGIPNCLDRAATIVFLPEALAAFIFAVIGEELGLVFTGGVVVLFMVLYFVSVCS